MIHYSSNLVVNIFGAPFGARQNFFGARLGRKLAFLRGAKGNVRGATPPAPMYAPKIKNAVDGLLQSTGLVETVDVEIDRRRTVDVDGLGRGTLQRVALPPGKLEPPGKL